MSQDSSYTCQRCQSNIQLLEQQIRQLIDRQNKLKRINNTLTHALQNQKAYPTNSHWKHKYQQEIQKTHQLQNKLSECNQRKYHQTTNNFKENQSLQLTLKSSRQKSIQKMDELMNAMLKNRLNDYNDSSKNIIYQPKRRSISNPFVTSSSKQIVVRIVDDRNKRKIINKLIY